MVRGQMSFVKRVTEVVTGLGPWDASSAGSRLGSRYKFYDSEIWRQ